MSFDRKQVHASLVEAGIVVYSAHGTVADAGLAVLSCIAEAREALSAKEFASWVVSEFGTGGSSRADGWKEGDLPKAMRAQGMLSLRAAKKGEERDASASALDVFLSRCRVTAHKSASDAAFSLEGSFRMVYDAASAKGTGSNASGSGKKAGKVDKSAEAPSAPVAVDLKAFKVFAESNLAAAIEMIEQIMVKRKDTIRAATLSAIRAQIVNSK